MGSEDGPVQLCKELQEAYKLYDTFSSPTQIQKPNDDINKSKENDALIASFLSTLTPPFTNIAPFEDNQIQGGEITNDHSLKLK